MAEASRRIASVPAFLLATAILHAPRIADACAVCGASDEDANRLAFILTTAFLTFLPLTLIGGVIWLFWRRLRAKELADLQTQTQTPARAGALSASTASLPAALSSRS